MSNKVKVVICGKDFTLQTNESSSYVFSLARNLESQINQIMDASSTASPFTAAIMVGMAALDDLNKANTALDRLRDQAKEYVDEAGRTRLERDAAIAEAEALKRRIEVLETISGQLNMIPETTPPEGTKDTTPKETPKATRTTKTTRQTRKKKDEIETEDA